MWASPVTLWTKPANTVGGVTISGLNATHFSVGVVRRELGGRAHHEYVLRGVQVEFTGGGKASVANGLGKRPTMACFLL
jgi:hypothetical protein